MIRYVIQPCQGKPSPIGLGATPQAVLTLAFAEIANSRCGSKRREEWKSWLKIGGHRFIEVWKWKCN